VKIIKNPHFKEWLDSLTTKEKIRVDYRLDRIIQFGHLGDYHDLDGGLWELRWKNGWRVYFYKDVITKNMVLVLGGNKNEQKKNIKQARNLFLRHTRS
jgi:putative addiction module killer protein